MNATCIFDPPLTKIKEPEKKYNNFHMMLWCAALWWVWLGIVCAITISCS